MLKSLFRTAAAALFVSAWSPAASASPAAPTVTVAQGRLAGVQNDGVNAFLGVPYAAPPVGELRWRAPRPAAKWSGVLRATAFGPNCIQNLVPSMGPWTPEYMTVGPASEDCLSASVWTPAKRGKKLPVLVWIHGGGFSIGGASVPVYDGSALAREGIVVVSINYRLGPLGFLPSPEFHESGGGNFGLQDQIAALRWVRQNVAAFGGDPSRVTIAGQSAGAASVHSLILSPQARGLFQRAIPQSGVGLGLDATLNLAPRDKAEATGAAFLKALGVGSIAEARKLPPEQILGARLKAGPGANFTPYADGFVLPADPISAFRTGRYNDVPVLIGMTADEGSGLNPNYRLADADKYAQQLDQRFGPLAPEIARLYPWQGAATFPSLIRDTGIAAMLGWIEARASTTRRPLYGYVFTHIEPGPEAARYGAFHTSEVPYVFGTLDKAADRPFTDQDRKLSDVMRGYWVNFVRTGNPNGKGLPAWPQFARGSGLVELGDRIGPYRTLSAEQLAVFRAQLARGGSLLVF